MVFGTQRPDVVHDLRQPIATIGALVAAVEGYPALPPEVRWHLEHIKTQVQELNELCACVLGAGPSRLVALDEMVTQAAQNAEIAHGCHIDVTACEAWVFGDAVDLRRAVRNLLENACRAAASNGVGIVVRHVDGDVRIEVSDAGPGFGAGPAGTASLGLRIVQGIVADHAGRVEIGTSTTGGAMVAIVLPPASEPWAGRIRAATRPPSLPLEVERPCPAS